MKSNKLKNNVTRTALTLSEHDRQNFKSLSRAKPRAIHDLKAKLPKKHQKSSLRGAKCWSTGNPIRCKLFSGGYPGIPAILT